MSIIKKNVTGYLLPINVAPEVGMIVEDKFGAIHILTKNDGKEYKKTIQPHHLYITITEELKEGDWFLTGSKIRQCERFEDGSLGYISSDSSALLWVQKWHKKIIATTNESLKLPELSKEFLKNYIDIYNSNNNYLKQLKVDYEVKTLVRPHDIYRETVEYLKLDKNNCINLTIEVETKSKTRSYLDNPIDEALQFLEEYKSEDSVQSITRFKYWLLNKKKHCKNKLT